MTREVGEPARRELTVLVAVERFPSRIQPWILSGLEQVIAFGGRVWIASASEGDASYPAKIDALGLKARTIYVLPGRPSALLRTLGAAAFPSERGRRVRRGLGRQFSSGRLLGGPARKVANQIVMAEVEGLTGVDVVHSHSLVEGYAYLEVARVLGAPQVHTFHGLQPVGLPSLPEQMRLEFFQGIHTCLVNTEFAKRQAVGQGCPAEKVRILPQGITLADFPYRPRARAEGEPLRLLTVARLHPDKGHRYAFEAVRRALQMGLQVNYRVVGTGPERENLERLVREMGIDDCVHFLGAVDDRTLLAEYANAHVFVLPSVRDETGHHEETQGVVIQEAQASGKIVVATRTGGIPECVDDGVSAFLVPDRSGDAIAEALARIAARIEVWPRWQQQGRQWVESRFDARMIGRRLWDVYCGAVARNGT
ncbi:MAG: glycosyltransferase [Gemmatimonadota bacterium]